ncbi:MAG: hypothetical protein V4528_07380 [Pseudomonadota bacterium]
MASQRKRPFNWLLANVFFIGDTLKERGELAALEDLKELSSAKAPSAGKDR